MLIFTRRVQEAVTIGADIKVTVLGIKGNQVRLGITAPTQIAVHREEVYYRIKQKTETGKAHEALSLAATSATRAHAPRMRPIRMHPRT